MFAVPLHSRSAMRSHGLSLLVPTGSLKRLMPPLSPCETAKAWFLWGPRKINFWPKFDVAPVKSEFGGRSEPVSWVSHAL